MAPTSWTATYALTADDMRKLRTFVRQSKDVPQLITARMYAICLLSALGDDKAPALGPKEFVEFLKLSPLYTGSENAIRSDSLDERRGLLARAIPAA
ncbi:MAG TPA: hypothetical protein VGL72_06415 [Bryobacteraceae bacterium]|jgi:hypothetical protein